MRTTNAAEEFLEHTGDRQVLCATIYFGNPTWACAEFAPLEVNLPINFSEKQFTEFISKLDVNYDAGYGGQELFGTIWYTDDTWSSREEYDGSEWWNHNSVPEIPNQLKGKSNEN
jgi:hypothetical protein